MLWRHAHLERPREIGSAHDGADTIDQCVEERLCAVLHVCRQRRVQGFFSWFEKGVVHDLAQAVEQSNRRDAWTEDGGEKA